MRSVRAALVLALITPPVQRNCTAHRVRGLGCGAIAAGLGSNGGKIGEKP